MKILSQLLNNIITLSIITLLLRCKNSIKILIFSSTRTSENRNMNTNINNNYTKMDMDLEVITTIIAIKCK